MRRRIILLSVAVTGLVVIAFSVPIAILVRQQAADRAQVEAERTAQSLAALVALTSALFDNADVDAIDGAVGPLQTGEVVFLGDGEMIGTPAEGQGSLIDEAVSRQETVAANVDGGWEIDIPVVTSDDILVVSIFVGDTSLTRGVGRAWLLLGLLGGVIVVAAVLTADRLGRSLVSPMRDLVEASHELGRGDLATRVEVQEPEEIAELGRTFNWLAGRLQALLSDEREAMADLSHDLRTPLTAMRLEAERLTDPSEKASVLSHVDRLEAEVDRLIERARAQPEPTPVVCDLVETVSRRHDFWTVLANDQHRATHADIPTDPVLVRAGPETVTSVVDAMIGNVFAHTQPGVGFEISVARDGSVGSVQVTDHGPGWPAGDIVRRGTSSAGSTGLGLDIARRAAETSGGSLRLDDRPGGGAVVTVSFALVQ